MIREGAIVTGATGWIGRHALDRLTAGPDASAPLYAFSSLPQTVETASGAGVAVAPLSTVDQLDCQPWLLFHAAFLTRDRVEDLGSARYIAENAAISELVRATIHRLRPRAVVYLSSGAVYGEDPDEPYAMLKRRDEVDFAQAAAAVGAAFLCPRVFNVSGPYMRRPERYALGDLILQALAGGPLVIKARGTVERSYTAASDLVHVLVSEAQRAEPASQTFDVASGETVEMNDLAEHVRDVCVAADRRILRERDPLASSDRYVGDPVEFARLAARNGLALQPLDEQIRATAAWLRQA